jgi:hypothetical protein
VVTALLFQFVHRKTNMSTIDLETTPHHSIVDELAKIISVKVRNKDEPFFRCVVAQALCVMASNMRAKVDTEHRGEIPVNGYTIALAPSGSGKGAALAILEEITHDYRMSFINYLFPQVADHNLWQLAASRAGHNGTEEQVEYDILAKELANKGPFTYAFSDITTATIQQIREQLLLAKCGALTLQVDEIGTNLSSVAEALGPYLELYDQGVMKRKLTKNVPDSKRTKEIEGKTPANAYLFGTPTKLLDGTKTEDDFYSLLLTGYARRCMFAFGIPIIEDDLTFEEEYDRLRDPKNKATMQHWSAMFAKLADPSKLNWTVTVPEDVGLCMMEYQIESERAAKLMPDHEVLKKVEKAHRYYKAIKLAGALAFIDEVLVMDMSHFHAAVKLVEESGEALSKILKREKNHVKLANYLASQDAELTHADILEALPFYNKTTGPNRTDMMLLATAWGYKNHVIIRRRFQDNIELFKGSKLKQTSLDSVTISYSDHFAYNYEPAEAAFTDLHQLTQAPDLNWCAHSFKGGHRSGENTIPGFNLMVLDIDGTTTLQTVHDFMQDHVFMTYTTKRHTPDAHRFRLILPMNYTLELDKEDYKAFMTNVMSWLPFTVDGNAAVDQVRKWATCSTGNYHYNLEGQLIDVLPFVPQTARNDQYRQHISKLTSLDALERWFAQRFADGNRNNLMAQFAFALVSSGMDYQQVEEKVLDFNKKLTPSLSVDELRRTVLVSVAKKLQSAP